MKNKKILLVIILLIGLAGVAAALLYHQPANKTSAPQQGPTPEQKKQETDADADAKKTLIDGSRPNGDNTASVPQSPRIELGAQQEANADVTVFTKLYNVSDGSCTLVVKNGANQSTQSATVIYQPQYSSCAGFSVPYSSLGGGNWEIALTVTSSGQTYSKNITFAVK